MTPITTRYQLILGMGAMQCFALSVNQAPYTEAASLPNFVQQFSSTDCEWSRPDLVALLNPILDASHTRNMKISPPNSACFPGTRLKVTTKIRSWMDSSLFFANPHIMWVYGYVGCGKSAIAQEMAMHFTGENRLAAAFFFFCGAGDRGRITRFATTVASQVAASIPAAAPIIEAAIKANPALLRTESTSLAAQFEDLVFRPIDAIKWDNFAACLRYGPFLIVLDGVDECEDRDEVGVFIDRMIEFFDRKPRTPLQFLITSRVDNHIHQRLHSSKQVCLLDLVEHTSNEDILSALEAAIAKERRGRLLACDESWPSLEDKVKLVEHIGGSYIFMTTILKSLFDPSGADGLTPMERLPVVLGMSPDFDGLYKAILEPWKHLPHFQSIISVIALALEPLSIAQITNILDIGTATVVNGLINLHAIMQIPGDDRTPVTLWHTSLRDFLCSQDRAGTFLAHDKPIAHGCLSLLAAASGGLPDSPATQYSTRFAKRHWVRFLESMDDDTGTFNQELGDIMISLQKAFNTSTVTEFHFCVFDKLLHHLEGVASSISRAGCVSSGTSPPPSLTLTQDHKWRALRMVIHPEEWQTFCSTQMALSPTDVPEDQPHWVSLLLERGSDPDLSGHHQEDFKLCLHAVCSMGREDLLELLLQYGVDPNSKVESGKTPLRATTTTPSAQRSSWITAPIRLRMMYPASVDRAGSLHSLAASLQVRSEETGSIPDIDEAIRLEREVLEHHPQRCLAHAESLRSLAGYLHWRSTKSGSIPDINEAICLKREVLEGCPQGHPNHPVSLHNLALSIHSRSEKTGSIPDINEAIRLKREVLEHRPQGHPDHAGALRELAVSLHLRFEKSGSIPDIDEAIRLKREVLQHCPLGHPDHANVLRDLAVSLHWRSMKTGSVPNIDEAIRLKREVLEHRSQGHPDHEESLRELANSLWSRFRKVGSMDELREAVGLDREVLELHPPGYNQRAKSLKNLAVSLRSLAKATGDPSHSKEADNLEREANELRLKSSD